MTAPPSLRLERRLLAEGAGAVAGMDEVGRGAWAGPVTVGVAVVTAERPRRLPVGLRDSKALSPAARLRLAGPLAACLADHAVGHASHAECDALGMTAAEGLAALRALALLAVRPEVIVLDGSVDVLAGARALDPSVPPVRTVVRGDASVASVAAASVLAKVARDQLMADEAVHYPWYGFDQNRGYPAPVHRMALQALGLTPIHRRSWAYVDGLVFRPEAGASSGLRGARGLLRQAEDPLGEDVAHDLVGAAGDPHAGDAE